MGYTTDFYGAVTVEPPLNEHEASFLRDLAGSRRMNRHNGPLFAEPGDDFGQGNPGDVIDTNRPDPDQPGLWLQWIPTDDGSEIEWDGGEKFYNAAEWMTYIVTNLFAPSAKPYVELHKSEDPRLVHFTCDHVINGEIEAQGEERGDQWLLVVKDNEVSTADGHIVYDSKAV